MLVALFAASLSLTPTQETPPDHAVRAAAREAQFQRERFTQAGFAPVPERQPESFRRLLVHEPRAMFAIPGIEIARDVSGAVHLTVQYRGWALEPVALDPGVWEQLTPEAEIFGPQPPPVDRVAPGVVCHAWGASIQSDDGRIAGWHGCSRGETPVSTAAVQMIRLAMSTRPDCAFEEASAFPDYMRCFRPSETLGDPALDAVFSPLMLAYGRLPGSDRLMVARQRLQALGDTPSRAAWDEARRAIAEVRAVNDARRGQLQQLVQLSYNAADASAADKAKMRMTIEAWSAFLNAQEGNYSALLEDLLRRSGPASSAAVP